MSRPSRARCAGVSSPELLTGRAAAGVSSEEGASSIGRGRAEIGSGALPPLLRLRGEFAAIRIAPRAASQGAEALALQLDSSCLSVLLPAVPASLDLTFATRS